MQTGKTVLALFILVFLLIVPVSGTVIVASSTTRYSSDSTASVTNSGTTLKELNMTDSYTGSWRIYFELQCGNSVNDCVYAGHSVTGQILKNGVAYGTSHTTSSTGTYVAYSQDFTSISISSGDKIQLYAYTTGDVTTTVYVRNFRVQFNDTNPAAPVNIASTTGNFWANTTWSAGTSTDSTTDSYNVSVNNVWTNGSANNYTNSTLSAHAWQNVSVWAWNSSFGKLSLIATSKNTQIPNNIPTVPSISYPSNNSRNYNNSMNFTWSQATDADSDTLTYHWQHSTSPTFATVADQGNTSNLYSGSFSTTDGTTNYLRIRSNDSYNFSAWSNTIIFIENTAPTVTDVTLTPSKPTVTNNLTVSMNASDAELDNLTKYYRWYKNGVLQTAWNDLTTILYTGNYTSGDSIYVKGYAFDGYENSTQLQSNTVIVGSTNSAPILPGITLNPSTKKYNKTILVNSSNVITDTESAQVQLQVYWYNNTNKTYFANSSWVTPPSNASVQITIPWNDALTHTIYAQALDSGSIAGLNNLTSSEVSATFTSSTTAPTITNSSLSATSITVGDGVTITAVTNGQGANISSATIQVERPDATIANWTMTCTAGETATCTKSYTSTADVGTYYIRNFYITDDSGITGTYSSSLTFNAASVVVSSGGGGGSSSSTVIIKEETNKTNISDLLPPITWVNVTDTRSAADLEKIGKCLSQDFMLSSACSGGTINIVKDPMNYWVLVGAYLFSFIVIFVVALIDDKPRAYFTDTLLYGTFAVIFVMLFTLVGLNMFVLNFVFQSSLPGYMFGSFGVWAAFISIAGDQFSYSEKKTNRTNSVTEKVGELASNVHDAIEQNYAVKQWDKIVKGK